MRVLDADFLSSLGLHADVRRRVRSVASLDDCEMGREGGVDLPDALDLGRDLLAGGFCEDEAIDDLSFGGHGG